MEILLLFGAFLVCCVAAIGSEKPFPRDTDDLYTPDVRREANRRARKQRPAEMDRIRSEWTRR